MKDASELKGLGDLRTSITTHLRSKPAQEGTEYLDLYLAGNESIAKLEKEEGRAGEQRRARSSRQA